VKLHTNPLTAPVTQSNLAGLLLEVCPSLCLGEATVECNAISSSCSAETRELEAKLCQPSLNLREQRERFAVVTAKLNACSFYPAVTY